MSKNKKPKHTTDSNKSLEFIVFWGVIAQELGSSRLKINRQANNIHDFIDPNDDAKDFLKLAIKESYKRSQCSHLRSPISINSVLDILGETAFKLRHDQRDDLFDIELLEEIAWHISNRYSHHLKIKQSKQKIDKDARTKGKIISFPTYKIRIANARL